MMSQRRSLDYSLSKVVRRKYARDIVGRACVFLYVFIYKSSSFWPGDFLEHSRANYVEIFLRRFHRRLAILTRF